MTQRRRYRQSTKFHYTRANRSLRRYERNQRNYQVSLYRGWGYQLDTFGVKAYHDEEALEKAVAYVVRKGLSGLFYEVDEVEELAREESHLDLDDYIIDLDDYIIDNDLLYVDGTPFGADRPVYIDVSNVRIEEVSEFDRTTTVINETRSYRTRRPSCTPVYHRQRRR